MSKRIVRVKPGTKNVFGILGVKIKKDRKPRKVKRERLPSVNDEDEEEEYFTPEEREAYIANAKIREGWIYAPRKRKTRKPKSG